MRRAVTLGPKSTLSNSTSRSASLSFSNCLFPTLKDRATLLRGLSGEEAALQLSCRHPFPNQTGTMQNERLFNQSGFYGFVLQSNVLLHRQAAVVATEKLGGWLAEQPGNPAVRILDLACGGWPASIAAVMANHPHTQFHYSGMDINPDQVALASGHFEFPENVASRQILEGNAWDPLRHGIRGQFDLVYSGMNLHHGTPEELAFLAEELSVLIRQGGLFISHDVYRPDHTPYVRRPDANPQKPDESWQLVPPDLLKRKAAAQSLQFDSTPAAWREDYLAVTHAALLDRGADRPGADETARHMRQRDFPVSCSDFQDIFNDAGFTVEICRFDEPNEPLSPYISLCTARPR